MTRLLMTFRHFIRPVIGGLAVIAALAMLVFLPRTATVKATDEKASRGTETITATFNANPASLGAIPDGPAGVCGDYTMSTGLNVTFNVTGLTGTINDVRISMTFNPAHTWGGDVWAELRSPNNTAVKTIFRQRGSTTATGCGSANDLGGPYNFFDTAALTTFNSVAGTPTPSGDYQAITHLTGVATPINPTFTPLPSGQVNGTWTLNLGDGAGGDTGTASAAVLTVTTSGASIPRAPVDFDGDNRTDYVISRETGPVPGEGNTPINWWIQTNGSASTSTTTHGLGNDIEVPADYDGDNRADIAIWRPDVATQARFLILQSSNGTVRTELFGQNGDNPTVVGDYDGDAKADPAVFRCDPAAVAGTQCFWYYRGSLNNPGGNITYIPWGSVSAPATPDIPSPGDFDGNGRLDFIVKRRSNPVVVGAGDAIYYILQDNGTVSYAYFGNYTDVDVRGDFDGDGRKDFAVVRNAKTAGAQMTWYVRYSSAPTTVFQVNWGLGLGAMAGSGDYLVPGDYNGDGRTDFAVWRPSANDGQNYFYVLPHGATPGTVGSFTTLEWGQCTTAATCDFPAANYLGPNAF